MSIASDLIKRFEDEVKRGVKYLRRGMSYLGPEDDWVEGLKLRIVTALDPFARPFGRNLVFHAHDKDYMYTVAKDSDAVERALDAEYQRNAASTHKYRYVDEHGDPIPKGEENDVKSFKQWSVGSWVLDPDDTDWQHHVYLFDNGDIGHPECDIYGHKETSAEKNPYGHVTNPQEHGDPDENVIPLLANAGIQRLD